ncbi:MAG: hypothetical protein KGJ07_01190 [Patescibacteria group bacterium]|nr:hypothetical protein [Patescibacteria group bacterium]
MAKEKVEKKEKKESSFDLEDTEWDKKKIIAGVALFALLLASIIGLKLFVLPKSIAQHIPIGPAVKGTSTVNDPNTSFTDPTPASISLPTTEDLQKKIGELQQQITHLSMGDIASSSPQIQQLIQSIEALPKAPGNAAKDACIQMCNRL